MEKKRRSGASRKSNGGVQSPVTKVDDNVSPVASPLSSSVIEVSPKTFSDADLTNDESNETSIESSKVEGRMSRTSEDAYTQLQSIVTKLRRDKEVLKLEVAEKDRLLQESNNEVEHLHNGLKSLQSQFMHMEKENKKARHTLLELTEANGDNSEEYQKKISELSEEVDRLNSVVELLEADKEQLIAEHKVSLESSLSDLEIFRNELSDTIAELNASYTQLARVEEAHVKDINSLRSEMSAAAEASSAREQCQLREIEELIRQCGDSSQLSSECERLQGLLEAAEKDRAEQISRNTVLEAKQTELVSTFRVQLIELQTEYKTVCEEKARLESELAKSKESLESVNDQLKSRTVTLEKAKKAYKAATAEKEKLSVELAASQAACESQTAQLAEVKAQLEVLTKSADESTLVIEDLKAALTTAETTHTKKATQLSESLKFCSDDLCATTNELNSAQATITDLRQEIQQLTLQRDTVDRLEIERLQKDLVSKESVIVSLREELSCAQEEVGSFRDASYTSKADNDEQLGTVKSQLLMLIESQAALQSENSAVLANITELERRYSDAVADLDDRKQKLRAAEEQITSMQSEFDQLRQELVTSQASLEESKATHASLKKKAVQLKTLYQTAASDLKAAQEEKESIRNDSASLVQQQTIELDQLRKDIDECRKDRDRLAKSLDETKSSHSMQLAELTENHQRSVSSVNEQLVAAQDLTGILQSEVSDLTASLSENKSIAEELWRVKEQLSHLHADSKVNQTPVNGNNDSTKVDQGAVVVACQAELEEVRQELMASLLDMSAFSHVLSQAHGQLLVLKELVSLRLVNNQ